ncbi:MAG: methyltransferase domain-containing protein [Actinobacteria bacterium]|nr:methyltransferase domain-containing protein [Actinomycetota bacterium]
MADTDQVRAVREYYIDDDSNGAEPSIYHIWEKGGGRGNVTTPATSSPPYREWIVGLLRGLLADSAEPRMLSIGCGNGMVEAIVAGDGTRVLAVDAMEPAIELARARGLDAVCADVLSWTPPSEPWTMLFADGSLGHLYDSETGLQHVLSRFRSWLPEGSLLVLSNDPPWTGDDEVQRHRDLAYWFLSQSYLEAQVAEAGFSDVRSEVFSFVKPETGPRDRIVVIARR